MIPAHRCSVRIWKYQVQIRPRTPELPALQGRRQVRRNRDDAESCFGLGRKIARADLLALQVRPLERTPDVHAAASLLGQLKVCPAESQQLALPRTRNEGGEK